MNASLISLISILSGIMGGVIFGHKSKSVSLGLPGNIIAGVFGSIFIIKTLGRLGVDPNSILINHHFSVPLLGINLTISLLGGAGGVFLLHWFKLKMHSPG